METNREPQGYSALYKSIAVYPELGLFRRFGQFWAKKLHDDTSEFLECLTSLNDQLGRFPDLGGKTVLDCPLRIVKEKCPKGDETYDKLWDAWREYNKSLLNYDAVPGQTLCQSEQIMNLPHQDAYNTSSLTEFKPPGSRPIFENDTFVPTGERAATYQGATERNDTCAWRAIPRKDFLTMRFIYSSKWIEAHVLARLRRCTGRTKSSDPRLQTDMRLDRIISVMDTVSCLLASTLLLITVFVLAVVHPLKIRIAIVGVTGTVFALCVKLMAGDPSRGEVFGATAAFYAVAVVFLSSTNDNCVCL
ncbi:uncharacterized protein K460DRAFT_421471 [Cucurbitaria berberidis CBS 394.84]|uniref:DUF6594 domain-containing protein n=1 Tax=Cucurbitaria berberidis CBS 394.84 TaxID=1168544 RepID=A0A9P4L3P8_9PLEO|nr:uncharacterized protein K460DRAFT_421471 [Cucurbitaria berberidis CBS 394.84]KAF1840532.1 hypothetical protein K460DRAFT_421471 [Cucurbitaria berberidis CBS 394.84]